MVTDRARSRVAEVRDIIDNVDAQLIAVFGRIDPSAESARVQETTTSAARGCIETMRTLGVPMLDSVATGDGRSVPTGQYLAEISAAQFERYLDDVRYLHEPAQAHPADASKALRLLVRRNWLAGPLMAPYKLVANLDPAQDHRVAQQRAYWDSIIEKQGAGPRGDALHRLFFRIGSADAHRYQEQFFNANSRDLKLPDISEFGGIPETKP